MAESRITAQLDALIAATSPQSRLRMARLIAFQLRRKNARRIAEQKTPDGESFVPRKTPSRHKKGRLRNKMFQKIATARHLKVRATPNAAIVEFTPAAGRIARVHHRGLEGEVRPGIRHRYAQRRLLGIADDDRSWVEGVIIEALKNN